MFNFNLVESTTVLLVGNLLCIVLAIIFGYDFLAVVWAFWFESIIIGFFTFLKLSILGNKCSFPIQYRILGKPPQIKKVSGVVFALFFAFHYGIFHMVYFGFLSFFSVVMMLQGTFYETVWGIFLTVSMATILFFSHLYSFYKNVFQKRKQIKVKDNFISTSFIEPYSRIIPLHIIIILFMIIIPLVSIGGILGIIPLLIFMSLKTLADLYAHQKKNKLMSKS